MIVMKFGGTSVGNAAAIKRVAAIVTSRLQACPAVVVSATAKTTDELVTLYNHATGNRRQQVEGLIAWFVEKHAKIIADLGMDEDLALRELLGEAAAELAAAATNVAHGIEPVRQYGDVILSSGEKVSANILTAYLRTTGLPAQWIDARELVITDSRYGRARPSFEASLPCVQALLVPQMEKGNVPVTQGFVGRDPSGKTTTLGRGGSDYSATFLGAAAGVDRVEIWTDVDGILTADPSLVPNVRRIRHMTFEEAAELAYFGAKVLHPSTILPAIKRGIPVVVLNSMKPEEEGTEILPFQKQPQRTETIVKSIAYKEGLTTLTIRSTRMLMSFGYLANIFEVFNRYETAVDLVSTSEVSVSVTIDSTERLDAIRESLSEFSEIEVETGKAIVSVVGENMRDIPGMPARIFRELEDIEIHLISQGASEINISFVIDEEKLPIVINRLHQRFFNGPLREELFAHSRHTY